MHLPDLLAHSVRQDGVRRELDPSEALRPLHDLPVEPVLRDGLPVVLRQPLRPQLLVSLEPLGAVDLLSLLLRHLVRDRLCLSCLRFRLLAEHRHGHRRRALRGHRGNGRLLPPQAADLRGLLALLAQLHHVPLGGEQVLGIEALAVFDDDPHHGAALALLQPRPRQLFELALDDRSSHGRVAALKRALLQLSECCAGDIGDRGQLPRFAVVPGRVVRRLLHRGARPVLLPST
mmetsp:Transcript_16416/g.47021  ORF Transcript_16416/g.47021 Transcript_16416/m.47021 type:complete len:233 (+) Transcript_16416:420-1118(+)